MQQYKLPNGQTVFHINGSETRFLYKEIFENRSYLRHGLALKRGACIFDVGGNIGLGTLFFHNTCADARLFVFEPSPSSFEVLKANVHAHRIQARLFNCALSNVNGTARLTHYSNNTVMSGLHANPDDDRRLSKSFMINSGFNESDADLILNDRFASETIDCPVRTLSDVMSEERVTRIDLLKVDVEKAELEVIQGITPEDWSKIDQVIIEVHDICGRLKYLSRLLEGMAFVVTQEQDLSLRGTGLYSIFGRRAPQRKAF